MTMMGKKETIDSLRKKFQDIWDKSLSNEWGRLAQGNRHSVIATNTIEFIGFKDLLFSVLRKLQHALKSTNKYISVHT